jgi:hypothetical protein
MSNVSPFNIEHLVQKYALNPEERELLETLVVDESQREQISQYDQRTVDWLKARENRLTASRFGAARGHCQYTSHNELLKGMLWGEFTGNAATEWGNKHESTAVEVYTKFMRQHKNLNKNQFRVTHCGLLVSLKHPWVGVSVDAFVFDDSEELPRKKGGGEIKCPYGKKLYPFIPSQYYDQIQGTMGFLELPWWDFVVWTPTQTQIRRYNFDQEYFDKELFPRLEQFYFTQFLPRAVMKKKGLLKPGKIDPVIDITVDESEDTETSAVDVSQSHVSVKPDSKGRFNLSAVLR